jgi:hypothetical protein
MRTPKLEIGIILAFLPFVLGGTVFSGVKLSNILNPYDNFSPTTIFLSIIVWVLAAVSFALIITLVTLAIKLIGDFNTGFWSSTATLLQEVSAWLIIYWIFLWGLPFTLGMSVYIYLSQHFNQYVTVSTGLLSTLFFLILLRKFLPNDIWKASEKFDPKRSLGLKKGLTLTLVFIVVGSAYLHTCYIFEVKLPSTVFRTTDQIEIRARISGRIANQESLRVKIVAINSVDMKIEPRPFLNESNGNYVAWIDLSKMTPGEYRIVIYFSDYETASIFKKFSLWMIHHNLQKSFIVRIAEHSGSA